MLTDLSSNLTRERRQRAGLTVAVARRRTVSKQAELKEISTAHDNTVGGGESPAAVDVAVLPSAQLQVVAVQTTRVREGQLGTGQPCPRVHL